MHKDKVSRFCWSMGLIQMLIYREDGAARGAVVRVSKKYREILRAKNKLYAIEIS